jgi:hypothetical protein
MTLLHKSFTKNIQTLLDIQVLVFSVIMIATWSSKYSLLQFIIFNKRYLIFSVARGTLVYADIFITTNSTCGVSN